jgi:hypothetical protein
MADVYSEQMQASMDGSRLLNTQEFHGRVRIAYAHYEEVAVTPTWETIGLIRLPQGAGRFLGLQSRVSIFAFGASQSFKIGWQAYINQAGVAQAENSTGFNSAVTAGTGVWAGDVLDGAFEEGAGTWAFDSKEGIVIFATKITRVPRTGDKLALQVSYVMD